VHGPDDPRIFERECRTLAEHGYTVGYLCPGAASGTKEGVELLPLPVRPRRRRVGAVPEILRAVHCWDARVVHLHDPELLTLAPALKGMGLGVVYDMHEYLTRAVFAKHYIPSYLRPGLAGLAGLVERSFAAFTDGIVAVTEQQLAGWGERPTLRALLPNYPRISRFAAPRPVSRLAEDVRLKLVHIGTLSRPRGVPTMLEAMRVAGDGAVLYLGGVFHEPELQTEVEASLASDPLLRRRVHLLGRIAPAHLPDYLAAAEVVWIAEQATSQYAMPAHSTKLYEGMAVGLAALTSDLPGRGDLVRSARCGLAVPPTVAGHAAGLLELLEHRDRVPVWGARGRARVRERCSWEAIESGLLAFYEGILAAQPDRRRP
jgi:glycosyltransferase involved in cell wall biosynthesis